MIRVAKYEDVDAIMQIVRDAQHHLRDLGIDQWQDGYPSREVIMDDIEAGVGYLLTNGEQILGYAAILLSGEKTYLQLDSSMWHTPEEYVVVHRLCVRGGEYRRGLATELMQHAARIATAHNITGFRIDTHRGNIRMLSMLSKLGFEYCGIILYPSGERLAYDLNINISNRL